MILSPLMTIEEKSYVDCKMDALSEAAARARRLLAVALSPMVQICGSRETWNRAPRGFPHIRWRDDPVSLLTFHLYF